MSYQVDISENNTKITYLVRVLDASNTEIAHTDTKIGKIEVPEANFWWPYLMHDNPGYQYKLKVNIYALILYFIIIMENLLFRWKSTIQIHYWIHIHNHLALENLLGTTPVLRLMENQYT